MTGEIGGNTVFHIPQEYENMLTQLQQALIEALKQQWPNTQFTVEYGAQYCYTVCYAKRS